MNIKEQIIELLEDKNLVEVTKTKIEIEADQKIKHAKDLRNELAKLQKKKITNTVEATAAWKENRKIWREATKLLQEIKDFGKSKGTTQYCGGDIVEKVMFSCEDFQKEIEATGRKLYKQENGKK